MASARNCVAGLFFWLEHKENAMDESTKKNRKKVGMTQFELSVATGIPNARITFAETGRTRLTKEELAKIKEAIRKRAKEIAAAFA
jgi:hypothetical protein